MKCNCDLSQLHPDAKKQLDKNLEPDENVKVIIKGEYNSAIIGTETRAFVYKKGIMGGNMYGSNFTSWDYLNLSGIQVETGALMGVVALQGPGIQAVNMNCNDTGLGGPNMSSHAIVIGRPSFEQARDGVAALRTLISGFQKAKLGRQTNIDIPDQIRKLAELREEGILTTEEFEQKKKELLSRM